MEILYKEESKRFEKVLKMLKEKSKKVSVIGHVRPDGDCIGSTVATVRILRSLGFDAVGINNDKIPENLKFLIGDTPFYLASEFNKEEHLCITVDSADYKRVGALMNDTFPKVYLNIDHHISNKAYANNNIVIGNASATAEILAGMALDLGYSIDPITAQALYVGIATDTGQFRFPSTTKNTFKIVEALINLGAEPSEAANALYENESFARIKLIQLFLATLEMHFDGKICCGYLSDSIYYSANATMDDADGLVDYPRSIKGVEIAVLLEERNGSIKGSLRAKDPKFRVDQIAQVFGGGGHACAAGLNVADSNIESFKPLLLSKIKEQLGALGLA